MASDVRPADLAVAELNVCGARVEALIRGDDPAASRLAFIGRSVAWEAEYLDGLRRCLPPVKRRDDAPPNAALGWFWRYDPAVRAARQTYGLEVD